MAGPAADRKERSCRGSGDELRSFSQQQKRSPEIGATGEIEQRCVMCQMKVVVEKQGEEQQRFEDVSSLSVDGSTIRISTLFAEAAEVKNAAIRSIDFMGGLVLVQQNG